MDIDYAAEIRRAKANSAHAYYYARKLERDAEKYQKWAETNEKEAQLWSARINSPFADGSEADHAEACYKLAAQLRRLEAQAIEYAPQERERGRSYAGIARRYERRLESGEW